MHDAEFPEREMQRAGYLAVGSASGPGTASRSCPRGGEPVVTANALPGDKV